jgi:hypothetical protein
VTNSSIYEIYATTLHVYYVINGTLVHTVTASTTSWTANVNQQSYLGNTNSGGGAANASLNARAALIYRLGNLETAPVYKHITTAGTYILKYSPGILHRIILNNAAGTLITIYDNTAGSGPILGIINTPAAANSVSLQYDVSFSTGLTFVTTGTWDLTVVYQ